VILPEEAIATKALFFGGESLLWGPVGPIETPVFFYFVGVFSAFPVLIKGHEVK
jgi:hypothetical protein